MTGIFLLGDRADDECGKVLRQCLPQAAFVGEKTQLPDGASGLLIQEGTVQCVKASRGILLLKKTFSQEGIALSGDFWCVFDSAYDGAAEFAKAKGIKTLTCGFSPYDTMTLSSITPERAVVTLQREIHTLDGQLVEPADYPVILRRALQPHTILLCCAALLLLGLGGEDNFVF